MQKLFRNKIYVALFLLFGVLTIGIFGFHFFWGASWTDALYMTVITVSTVGYREVLPLDDSAKLFTVFLIVTSVTTAGYSISVITQYLVNFRTISEINKRKKMKELEKIKDHVIVCGYGRNGREAATKLKMYKMPFLVIEKNEEIIEKFEEETDILFIHGDANEDHTLELARIKEAQTLITALPKDTANVFVVLTARQMNPKLRIISRASEESSVKKLKFAGADNVVMPDHIGGDHMASLVVVPDLVEFLDSLNLEEDESPNLEEMQIEELRENCIGKSLMDINLRKRTGCTVIGYKEPNGNYIVNPAPELVLQANSKLIVLGNPEQIMELKKLLIS